MPQLFKRLTPALMHYCYSHTQHHLAIGDFRQVNFTQISVESLLAFVKRDKALHALNFQGCRFAQKQLGLLCQAIHQSRHITALNFSDTHLTDAQVRRLCNALTGHGTITELNLSFNKIGDTGMAAVADLMATTSSLKHLDCSSNSFADIGWHHVAKALKVNKSLTSICLANNNAPPQAVKEWLTPAIAQHPSLSSLNLMANNFMDDDAIALAEAVQHQKHLGTLVLGGHFIGDEGASALANTTLTELNLAGDSPIRQKGISTLLSSNIERLHLDNCSIYPDYFSSDTMTFNTLSLSGNPIGINGLRSLSRYSRIEALNISNCDGFLEITARDVQELFSNNRLRRLAFSAPTLSDEMLKMCQGNQTLNYLQLSSNDAVTDKGYTFLPPSLQTLRLSARGIKAPTLASIDTLPNLTTLIIGGNYIDNEMLSAMANMKNIEVLKLTLCHFSDDLDLTRLLECKQLKSLHLTHCTANHIIPTKPLVKLAESVPLIFENAQARPSVDLLQIQTAALERDDN